MRAIVVLVFLFVACFFVFCFWFSMRAIGLLVFLFVVCGIVDLVVSVVCCLYVTVLSLIMSTCCVFLYVLFLCVLCVLGVCVLVLLLFLCVCYPYTSFVCFLRFV